MARTSLQRSMINRETTPAYELTKGMIVYDIGIPHITGKIVELGPEQSEVKWKTGQTNYVGNIYLAPAQDKAFLIKISRRGDLKSSIPFAAAHVAAKFIDACIGDEKYTWRAKDMIALSESGFELSCEGLEGLVEYKYKKHEKAWELPEPYRSWAREICTGIKSGRDMPEPIGNHDVSFLKPLKDGDKAAARRGTRRPPPDSGLVPLSKICDELGVEGRIARGILRKKMSKGESGWNFQPSEVEAIKKLLKGAK